MTDRHPRRSARLAKLKENDDEEKRASRNEIHLFHFRYDYFCRPTELAANLSSFKSINDRTDRKFRHERLTSSRRMFSESEKKSRKEKLISTTQNLLKNAKEDKMSYVVIM